MLFGNTSLFEKCPRCGSKNAQEVRFVWWGGIEAAKFFNHAKRQTCGKTYDGETGKNNTAQIAVYFAVAGAVPLLIALLHLFDFI